MKNSSIFINTDSYVLVEGLRDRSGQIITTATVTLEAFVDGNGDAVSGVTTPAYLTHTGDGNYELLIPKDAQIVKGSVYYATIRAVHLGLQREWTETALAKRGVA